MPDSKYFGIPFATSGDKTAIPEATQPSGAISYQQGFGPDYERPPATDPLAKRVPRGPTNQLYFDLTNSVKYLQLYGLPEWYATDSAGGAVSYPLGARVRVGGVGWLSIAATNTAAPGSDATKWIPLDLAGANDIVVKGFQAAPPGSPVAGDRYVVAASPTGAWAGQANKIATYTGAAWAFTTPADGTLANYRVGAIWTPIWYNATTWAPLNATKANVEAGTAGVYVTPDVLKTARNPYFIATGSASFSIPKLVDTKINNITTLSSSFFNTGSSFATSAFTCGAADAGAWLFIGYAAMVMQTNSTAGTSYRLSIAKNGTTGPFNTAYLSNAGIFAQTSVTPLLLAANDVVDVRAYQDTETSRNVESTLLFGIRLGNS